MTEHKDCQKPSQSINGCVAVAAWLRKHAADPGLEGYQCYKVDKGDGQKSERRGDDGVRHEWFGNGKACIAGFCRVKILANAS